MRYTFEPDEGRLYLHRERDEKDELQRRLRRIEGQARGLQQMIEDDRHCLDDVQQLNALTSAAREVALLVIASHLEACVEFAVEAHDGQVAVQEMVSCLRAAMRQTG
ncbi:MAG TPA: metal-sensitive transcriptional regulator [Thermomicrobiales bacterium]|nr:metal-sensitive transcriptional regulator [Thermomicrobiales bacterium]